METASKKPGVWAKKMGLLGIGLCSLCCALPVIRIVGGTGILAVLSLYAENIALVLLIISVGLFVYWHYRKKQAPRACAVDCSCKEEHAESTVTNTP